MNAPAVVAVDPRADPRWRELAAGPGGSLFTSPPWLDAVCATYGFRPEGRVALDPAGGAVGGFAWVPIEDIRGWRLSSLPFSDRAEPPVADGSGWKELSSDAFATDLPLTLRCFDDAVPIGDPRLDAVGSAAWHGTPLAGTVDDLWAQLSAAARRNIARSVRGEVRIVADRSLRGIRAFHGLHVRLRKRKYRLLAQPLELFERIWEAFTRRDDVVTLLAYTGDTLIAGAVFLTWNDTLYYKFGASAPEYLSLRPNDAVFWAGIRWGRERGLAWIDWGLSDLDQPGLIAYKRKWATTERRIVTLRPAGTGPPGHPEVDAVLGELTQLLTDEQVPDHITEQAGRLLYPYFC